MRKVVESILSPISSILIAALLGAIGVFIGSCANSQRPVSDSESTTPLTFSSPSWSIRGVVAYADKGYRLVGGSWSYVDSVAGLWLFDVSTRQHRRVSSFGDRPSWSPDGSEIVYWHNSALWVYGVDTGIVQKVLSNEHYNNPAKWSPCEDPLIFASTEGAPYDYTIWSLELATGIKRHLTPNEGGLRDPVWFANCDSILYKRYEEKDGLPVSRIYVMSGDGNDTRKELESDHDERALTISPDGKYIGFHSPVLDGRNRIYIYDRLGKLYIEGSGNLGQDVSWSPSGDKYIYVRRIGEENMGVNAVVVVVDLASGKATELF